MSNTVQIIEKLQQEIHRVISPLVPKSGKFAILDFPNYSNVGDNAIWLGELAYFKNWHKMSPDFVSSMTRYNHDQLNEALPEGTIFLQGGGNFGDIWATHQDFREKIITEFKDRKIVQLPQSLHFESRDRLKETARIINDHPDFTLLVRDRNSFKLATENFSCPVYLCPDMAFAMGPLPKPRKPSSSLLFLLRDDKEKRHESIGTVTGVADPYRVEDWLAETPNLTAKIKAKTLTELLPTLGFRMFNKYAVRELYYRRIAENRLARGLNMLTSVNFVITDRLHAHIISVLLDQQHVVLDNSYGKLSNFVAAWTQNVSNSYAFTDLDDAISFYNEKISQQHPDVVEFKKAG